MSQSHTHASHPSLIICAPAASSTTLLQRIKSAIAIARSRRALAKLDADGLADVGLTREQAQIEANRSVWDAPSHWAG